MATVSDTPVSRFVKTVLLFGKWKFCLTTLPFLSVKVVMIPTPSMCIRTGKAHSPVTTESSGPVIVSCVGLPALAKGATASATKTADRMRSVRRKELLSQRQAHRKVRTRADS